MSINYVEKGISLHEEIARQGYSLVNIDGVWVADDEKAVQFIIDNFVPPSPVNWDGWNELMLNDSNFSNICSIVNNTNPLTLAGLPAALTQVANGQITMFEKLFNYVCLIGGATQSMRDSWGAYATNCGLPQEFVNIIIGV